MGNCAAPGCSNRVGGSVRGRRPDFCSDTCRQRAHRQRRHELDAILVADLIAESPDRAVRLALAALQPSALAVLRAELSQAPKRVS